METKLTNIMYKKASKIVVKISLNLILDFNFSFTLFIFCLELTNYNSIMLPKVYEQTNKKCTVKLWAYYL